MPREIEGLREWECYYLEHGYPPILANEQIAEILKVSTRTVTRMKNDKRLPNKRYVPLREVVKLILKGA